MIGIVGDFAQTTWATVLFVDLRGYCALCERLPAQKIARLLQEFFRILVLACERNAGVICHMAGDGLMAAFGVRNSLVSGSESALSAAGEMLNDFAPVSLSWRETLSAQTGIGIGINAGEVAFLRVRGAPDGETLIGDAVNVAARLCGRARAGEVLFSDSVAAGLNIGGCDADIAPEGPAQLLRLPKVQLRGRISTLDVWCLPARTRVDFRGESNTAGNLSN